MKAKERESGIELLRIILMLQIIFLHVSQYGEMRKYSVAAGGSRELLWWVVWLSCRCPVGLFFVIQGYFMCKSRATIQDNIKKAGKTHRIMLFYSLGIILVMAVMKINEVSKTEVITGLFPAASSTWYFMTNYIIIVLLSPFINIMLNKLSKKEYQILIFVLPYCQYGLC